MKNGTKVSRPR